MGKEGDGVKEEILKYLSHVNVLYDYLNSSHQISPEPSLLFKQFLLSSVSLSPQIRLFANHPGSSLSLSAQTTLNNLWRLWLWKIFRVRVITDGEARLPKLYLCNKCSRFLIVIKNSKWLPCRYLVVDLFVFLTFHWLTSCHVTPFRIKPGPVSITISEHVSFSDEGPLLETFEFLTISLGVTNLWTFGLFNTVCTVTYFYIIYQSYIISYNKKELTKSWYKSEQRVT